MLKGVCVFITKVSIVADRMGNGKARQQFGLSIFMTENPQSSAEKATAP